MVSLRGSATRPTRRSQRSVATKVRSLLVCEPRTRLDLRLPRCIAYYFGMLDDCDVCGRAESTTGLNLVGSRGSVRVALCGDCGTKARQQDAETWEKIRAI